MMLDWVEVDERGGGGGGDVQTYEPKSSAELENRTQTQKRKSNC